MERKKRQTGTKSHKKSAMKVVEDMGDHIDLPGTINYEEQTQRILEAQLVQGSQKNHDDEDLTIGEEFGFDIDPKKRRKTITVDCQYEINPLSQIKGQGFVAFDGTYIPEVIFEEAFYDLSHIKLSDIQEEAFYFGGAKARMAEMLLDYWYYELQPTLTPQQQQEVLQSNLGVVFQMPFQRIRAGAISC